MRKPPVRNTPIDIAGRWNVLTNAQFFTNFQNLPDPNFAPVRWRKDSLGRVDVIGLCQWLPASSFSGGFITPALPAPGTFDLIFPAIWGQTATTYGVCRLHLYKNGQLQVDQVIGNLPGVSYANCNISLAMTYSTTQ